MKKLTKKQRKEVYLKVYERLEKEYEDMLFVCHIFAELGYVISYTNIQTDFPELYQVAKPEGGHCWLTAYDSFNESDCKNYIEYNILENKIKATCLAFAIAMC